MKLLLLIVFCSLTSILSAQKAGTDTLTLKSSKLFRSQNKDSIFAVLRKRMSTAIIAKGNGKAYYLSQDEMPCIVPDTNNIAAIPNPAVHYKFPLVGRMPGRGNKKSIILP